MLAALDDPHVVRLYEYVESPYGAAIVMELINGVSLREILNHQGATTAEAALVVLHGSLLGLAAAHQHGVVHRDYKPGNVLVNGDGDSKLTDFGIAVRAGDSPVPMGTMVYAPPEQFDGSPASRPATSTPPPPRSTSAWPATRRSPGTPPSGCSTSTWPSRCRWSRYPSRCARWWPPEWPRIPATARPTPACSSFSSARSRREPTAGTGSGAAGPTWARPPCCSPCCGRPPQRPRSRAAPWNGSTCPRVRRGLRRLWPPGSHGISGISGTSGISGISGTNRTSGICARSPAPRSCSLSRRAARLWP